MHIDTRYPGAVPAGILTRDGTTFEVRPFTDRSGSQTFHWRGRIEGLRPREHATILLRWPPRWTAADVVQRIPGASAETAERMADHESFARVLPRCLVSRTADRDWQPVAAELLEDGDCVQFTIEGETSAVEVATQLPYDWQELQDLLESCRRNPFASVIPLGHSSAGLDVACVSVVSPDPRAPVVYLQGFQHNTEFTGPIVLDRLLRQLLGPQGEALRAARTWHVTPVVNADACFYGPTYEMGPQPRALHAVENLNRDWQEGSRPETAAVRAFLSRLEAAGRGPRLALDLHNGWSHAGASGACYTILPDHRATAAYVARQTRFADHMLANTDHTAPGAYWHHDTGGTAFAAWLPTLIPDCIAHTVEFSRHQWWDRAAGRFVDASPDRVERFAAQFGPAICAFGLP